MTFEELEKKINSGHATYADVLKYAQTTGREIGVELARELQAVLAENAEQYLLDVEEARRIIAPAMRKNHEKVTEATSRVQKQINERMGLGLNPVEPEYNRSYENGLIYIAAKPEKTETFWTNAFPQSVENMSMATVDDALRENAGFHRKSGIRTRVQRYPVGNCCEWCQGLAGIYVYDDVYKKGDDVWRRHKNCDCCIDYVEDGKVEAVYNYREKNTTAGKAQRMHDKLLKQAGGEDNNTDPSGKIVKAYAQERRRITTEDVLRNKYTQLKAARDRYYADTSGMTERERFIHEQRKRKMDIDDIEKEIAQLHKKRVTIASDTERLKGINPGFGTVQGRSDNCQRVVVAEEMLNSGFSDIRAKPLDINDRIGMDPLAAWETKPRFATLWISDPEIKRTTKDELKRDLSRQMEEWGDGSRAIIRTKKNGEEIGHVFTAKNIDGTIICTDAQPDPPIVVDLEGHIKDCEKDVWFMRVDDRQFSDAIGDAVEVTDEQIR